MGTFLNPGKNAFEEAVRSEIYVDKTDMILHLNAVVGTKQKYVSVSRPRRFGKSMAADMICAYYDRTAESREVFENYKIAKQENNGAGVGFAPWDACLGRFDVVRIVMTRFFKKRSTVQEGLSRLQDLVIREFRKTYPTVDYYSEHDLLQTVEDVYTSVDRQVVFVIDEWDAVFRIRPDDRDGQNEYLDFLRDLLKDNDRIALAYMTGILPIKKYGEHSALNMFTEYSMMAPRQFAPYTGFTDQEVRMLCSRYDMKYEDIAKWYDGYRVSDRIPADKREAYRSGTYSGHVLALYSPLSVVESMTTGMIRNYWNKTESYEALAEYIRMDYDGLKNAVALLMDGGRIRIDTSSYQNDMTTFHGRDDVFSLLIHLGYLGYDDGSEEVFIPNREILDEFRTSTKSKEWDNTFHSFAVSQELLKATWNMEEEKVADLLEKAHDQAGNITYNSEAALSYAIQLAYYAAQKYYTTILELDTGKGFADIVYLPSPAYPDKPVLLIELKYDKTADTALSQINRQHYPDRLEHYKGNILLVGVNYDKETRSGSIAFKHHSCTIRRA